MDVLWRCLGHWTIGVIAVTDIAYHQDTGSFLPGITQGDDHVSQFWIAFWATLFAGIPIGIVGAFIVGRALNRLEDKRRVEGQRNAARRELASFKQRLRFYLDQPEGFDLDRVLHLIPAPFRGIAVFVADQPTDLWQELLPDQADFFSAVGAFQEAYSEAVTAANHIESVIGRGVIVFIREVSAGSDPVKLELTCRKIVADDLGIEIDNPLLPAYGQDFWDELKTRVIMPLANQVTALAGASQSLSRSCDSLRRSPPS